VQEALRSLKARLGLYKKTPANGLALFCGYHMNEDGKERKLMIDLEPLLPLTHSLYKCGSQFHTELLRAQLQEGGKYGFIIIDGHGVSFHILAGNARQTLYKWDNVSLPKKHGRGGQSQNRFARIRVEKRFNYISKVVDLAGLHFLDPSTNLPIVSGLVMAGCADFKHYLAKRLDPRLQKIISSFLDIQYNGESGFNQAIRLSSGVLKDCRLMRELKVLEEFFGLIANDGLFCFTNNDTMYALEGGCLERVVVWDELPDIRFEVASVSNPSVTKVVLSAKGTFSEPDWVITSSVPLLDWILDNYKSLGSALELVSDSSTLGSQFVKGFGGLGGFLRFPVEFPSRTDTLEEEDSSSDYFELHEAKPKSFDLVQEPLTQNEALFDDDDDDSDDIDLDVVNGVAETHKERKKRLEAEAEELLIANDDPREHVNVVFIGHVDAGKSTVSGQILNLTGMVTSRMIEHYQNESVKKNRASWFLAYVMDTNEEEMAKGITVEVGRAHFSTEKKRYTILDAPGHNLYVPNMMAGLAQADIGVLVISARKGEFEAGMSGQTCEHALLARTIGIRKLIVLINKMDDPTVLWDKSRFDSIQSTLSKFLKRIGFNVQADVIWVPGSGLQGTNILIQNTPMDCDWYSGPSLIQVLDALKPLDRLTEAPLRIPVLDKYKEHGKTFILGKVETGFLKCGDTVLSSPAGLTLSVVQIQNDSNVMTVAKPGENVKVVVKCSQFEEDQILRGSVLTHVQTPCPVTTQLVGEIKIFQLPQSKPLFTTGYSCIFHSGTTQEECVVVKLLDLIDPKTKQSIQKFPSFAKEKAVVQCRIKLKKPMCLEKLADFSQLGRFTLRDEGKTIGFGKVVDFDPTF